jgi:hypothetical protein
MAIRPLDRGAQRKEGRGVIQAQIDCFGQAGTIATLSPGLALILEHPICRPRPAKNTGQVCHRCGRPIQSFGFFYGINEPARPERVLRCDCLTIIYRPPITQEDVLRCWADFRRLKNQIITRLAPPQTN